MIKLTKIAAFDNFLACENLWEAAFKQKVVQNLELDGKHFANNIIWCPKGRKRDKMRQLPVGQHTFRIQQGSSKVIIHDELNTAPDNNLPSVRPGQLRSQWVPAVAATDETDTDCGLWHMKELEWPGDSCSHTPVVHRNLLQWIPLRSFSKMEPS